MDVGIFFGQTLSVAGVTAAVTQILKVAQDVVPSLKKIPVIGATLSWLVDTITPEDPAAIHIFVAFLCFGLNVFSTYMQTGSADINFLTLGQTLMSFLQANGAYVLLLKKFDIK